MQQVLDWLELEQPDILALQETKLTDQHFPAHEFREKGYHAVYSGQQTYNGVALLSKPAMTDVVTAFPGYQDPQRRVLGAAINGIYVLNLYVPNGASVGSEKYHYKLDWLARLESFVPALLEQHKRLIILGDFNIAPEDRDVHDPQEWAGKVLVSDAERAAFVKLLNLGLSDCFRLFKQEERSYSWWDYRAAGFRRNRGLRIDHALASAPLAESCVECRIDKSPRYLDRPSDHTPVIAVFKLQHGDAPAAGRG